MQSSETTLQKPDNIDGYEANEQKINRDIPAGHETLQKSDIDAR